MRGLMGAYLFYAVKDMGVDTFATVLSMMVWYVSIGHRAD
jgi:hypothetical protein